MKALHKALILVPLFAAVVSSPAAAQSWKWDFGVGLGFSRFSSALDEEDTGLADETGGAEIHWKQGKFYNTQLGFWFGPKMGLRFNGRYADRPLEGSEIENASFVTSTNLWGATADLMFRLKAPADEYTGMEVLPYLALGLGAKWHNGSEDGFSCTDQTNTYNCSPFVTGLPRAGTAPLPGQPRGWAFGEENAIAGLIGLGADFRVAKNIAIRAELSDQIFKPQFHRATTIPASGTSWNVGEENVSKLVHEYGASIGLQFLFGVKSAPVVAIAPPPPPPPAPAPAPEVRRESMTVCVVDPTSTNGLRMQTVTLVEGRDTVIVVGGSDRPFRESLGTIRTAAGADWYVQGQPLVMTIGTGKASFTTYGSTRVIDSNDVTYVGSINGYPVYADRDDVSAFISELNEQNRSGQDLGIILNNQKTLRTTFDNVKVLYVPTSASGCVFQAVQRQEEVRKSGK